MKHRTEDDFEQWLHGVTRFKAEQAEVSPEFLAAQRRSIYRRLEEQPRRVAALRWALSAAVLLVMVLGLTFSQLRKAAPTISDEQLFSDLAAMDQSAEPKAIQPMHKLFEE
jgi:ribosomal protein L16 Arg81 hydroxylase